ncbi:MAG: AAA domain-containing protein [Candidatus Aminicenantes bacterium]|nr:AAA domain-containing protein [Candidatus Aminicenantes bacterium]NIM83629.1 AAA domain-containing protein [Candidatus Aminicenantes bacterium]NIN23032.1 AAA domain-containing protein [Candidatus Aminicenantes bacterium]NIN46768.1 AAA domain-containing protein [Candidatus Aminicenantes bacterium]NIN89681.1 AAA domain-containing protein [Candidatus Aminicenantes bacterium]
MFESVKAQLWDILKQKQVSLVMIFDKKGDILWHKGREIEGKSIFLGSGFSKSFARKIIATGNMVKKKNVPIVVFGNQLSESAKDLNVKSLIIIPIRKSFFLYVDSGTKEYFTGTDLEVFTVMGELLEKMIEGVMDAQEDSKGITGVSDEIKKIREMVLKYSLEEEPLLLIGETGVGKSHYAELIHRYSGRKGKFVVAEITSINENLFESTMFGHKKGAFTDAKADKTGLVQEADKGTLFIDEIAEIPVSFQAKLLRFIEKKKYRVLGETRERDAEVRIVAASNRDLQKAIEDREFREDLYYRLQVLEIEIPPLRKRKQDIEAFITTNREYLKGKEIGESFWEVVFNYDWPGNMRELITVLKRAGILLESPITGEKIKEVIYGSGYKKSFTQPLTDTHVHEPGWKEKIREDFEKGKTFWEVVKEPFLNRDLNRQQVKMVLSEALEKTRGSYKDTLRMFNIDDGQYERFMKFLYRNHLN